MSVIKNDFLNESEIELTQKFLDLYKNKDVIIADECVDFSSIVPLNEIRPSFTASKDRKDYEFIKRIFHQNQFFIVKLTLLIEPDNSIKINLFEIVNDNGSHFVDLNSINLKAIFNDVIKTFENKKIISPEEAYGKIMYNNVALQQFINNHKWTDINKGINEMPELRDALFIINEGYIEGSNYLAEFGTILYQLLSYRINNNSKLTDKDIKEINKLILKLRKTELLKVKFQEYFSASMQIPTSSILIEANKKEKRIHRSAKLDIDNNRLIKEYELLKRVI